MYRATVDAAQCGEARSERLRRVSDAPGSRAVSGSGVNDDKTDVYLNDQQNKCTVSGRGGTFQGWKTTLTGARRAALAGGPLPRGALARRRQIEMVETRAGCDAS